MIAKLKIDLLQSKERVLSLEQRLQSECNSKVATYCEQLENLKKQYEEKVTKLNNECMLYVYLYFKVDKLYTCCKTFRLMN